MAFSTSLLNRRQTDQIEVYLVQMNEIAVGRPREILSKEQVLRVRCIVMDLLRNGIQKEGPVPGQSEPHGVSAEVNKTWDDNRI